jgi:hypothetical protein
VVRLRERQQQDRGQAEQGNDAANRAGCRHVVQCTPELRLMKTAPSSDVCSVSIRRFRGLSARLCAWPEPQRALSPGI